MRRYFAEEPCRERVCAGVDESCAFLTVAGGGAIPGAVRGPGVRAGQVGRGISSQLHLARRGGPLSRE
eukprot:8469687-Pyramimonas_sp.AAC.1